MSAGSFRPATSDAGGFPAAQLAVCGAPRRPLPAEEDALKPTAKDLRDPATALALSFGLGLAPAAPGTFGAAGAFLPYLLIRGLAWPWQLALAAAAFALGCLACGIAARRLGEEDPSAIVWDETAGMLITLVLIPATPVAWALGFIAFRALDINKPWLVGAAERRFSGGLGIMADDGVAGLGAAGIVWLVTILFGLIAG